MIHSQSNIETILDNAEKPEFKPEKKNIRENRMDERRLIDEKESVASKMESVKNPSLQDPTETQQTKEADEVDIAGEIKKAKKKGKTTKEIRTPGRQRHTSCQCHIPGGIP